MAKKKIYVGMLAAALAFALVLSGCDSDGNGTTDPVITDPREWVPVWFAGSGWWRAFNVAEGVTPNVNSWGAGATGDNPRPNPFNLEAFSLTDVNSSFDFHLGGGEAPFHLLEGDRITFTSSHPVRLGFRGDPWTDFPVGTNHTVVLPSNAPGGEAGGLRIRLPAEHGLTDVPNITITNFRIERFMDPADIPQ